MKTNIQNLFLLLAVLNLTPAGRATAQTYTIPHKFAAINCSPCVNSDGWLPVALALSGTTLYGTAPAGGVSAAGTVFAVNTNGTGFRVLHTFSTSDGSFPNGLVLSGDAIYGTTSAGGGSGKGTVFTINTDGTGFGTLYSFSGGSDGSTPGSGYAYQANTALRLSQGALYGTTQNVGNDPGGTIFTLATNGSSFATLYTFAAAAQNAQGRVTNSDGAGPNSLIISGDTIYGATQTGGSSASGKIFAVETDGTGFRILHSFTARNGSGGNSDGALPVALALSGSILYGATASGGSVGGGGLGTLFAVGTNGTGFHTVYSCTSTNQQPTGMVLAGNVLYGTSYQGGSSSWGALFAVNIDGSGFSILHSFGAFAGDGSTPSGALICSANTLYGTTADGGNSSGIVFRLSLPLPQLTIVRSGANVFLTWTNAAFGLQTAPASTGTFTNLPSATSPYTNALTGAQQYFRLISN